MELYAYRATVTKVVDGDTVDVDLDLGVHVVLHSERLRLRHVNAPEHGTAAGDAATKRLRELLPVGTRVYVRTELDRTEKYGRLLAVVWLAMPTLAPPSWAGSVQDQLVAEGLAFAWEGAGARPVT